MKVNTVETIIEDFRSGQNIFRRTSVELLVREISRMSKRIAELEAELAERDEYIVRTGINIIAKLDKPLSIIESLQKRIAELEEQQRWIPVSERLPEKETANCSRTVFLEINKVGVFKAYYNYYAELWVSLYGTNIFFQSGHFKNANARWMYEPQPPKDGK